MNKRVSQGTDYINELSRAIEKERAKDPDFVLPWDWWRKQAELYKVTPNNIYSRAVSRGLYTPPNKRTDAAGRAVESEAVQKEATRGERDTLSRATLSATPAAPAPPSSPPPAEREVGKPVRSSARLITERLQAMAEVAGALGEMEERIAELEREREGEASRRRETLRALDRLARVLEEASGTVAALQQLYKE